jgi:predicted alpha/beta hydrolase family esterase
MQKKIQKHQIVIIDGGESFANDAEALDWLMKCDWDLMAKMPSWKKWLADGLSDHFDTIRIDMPNTMNAKYEEWKIWFEKYFKHIHGTHHHLTHKTTLERIAEKKHDEDTHTKLILIGHSLGGTFLMKYLSESGFPRGIDALHLVAPALDDDGLQDESLATFRFSTGGLPHLHKSIHRLTMMSSPMITRSAIMYRCLARYSIPSMIGATLSVRHTSSSFLRRY